MALAMDGNGGGGPEYVWHGAGTDGRISGISLRPIHGAGLPLARGKISGHVQADTTTRERGPLGTGGRHVGGTGPEYALWRVTGAATPDWKTIFPAEVWSGCPDRLESGLLRL